MTSHTKTGQGVGKIRWYHWAVYRIFRWFWNPILKRNPYMAIAFSRHVTLMSAPVSAQDEAAIDALVRRRVGELKRHRIATTPQVTP